MLQEPGDTEERPAAALSDQLGFLSALSEESCRLALGVLMGDLAICTSSPLTVELPQAAGVVVLSISGFSSLS